MTTQDGEICSLCKKCSDLRSQGACPHFPHPFCTWAIVLLYFYIYRTSPTLPNWLSIKNRKIRGQGEENCATSYVQSKLIKKKVIPWFKLNLTSFNLSQVQTFFLSACLPKQSLSLALFLQFQGQEALTLKLGLLRSLSLYFLTLETGFICGQKEGKKGGFEREKQLC